MGCNAMHYYGESVDTNDLEGPAITIFRTEM
jgi:hypothetical protein